MTLKLDAPQLVRRPLLALLALEDELLLALPALLVLDTVERLLDLLPSTRLVRCGKDFQSRKSV